MRMAGVHLVYRRSDFCPDQVRLPVKVTELTRVLQHTGFSRATLVAIEVNHIIHSVSIFILEFIKSFFLKVTILLCIYPAPSAIPVRIQLATFHDDRSHRRWREREPGMCHLFCQPVFPITPLTPPQELTELWTYWQSASFPSVPSLYAPPTILSDCCDLVEASVMHHVAGEAHITFAPYLNDLQTHINSVNYIFHSQEEKNAAFHESGGNYQCSASEQN